MSDEEQSYSDEEFPTVDANAAPQHRVVLPQKSESDLYDWDNDAASTKHDDDRRNDRSTPLFDGDEYTENDFGAEEYTYDDALTETAAAAINTTAADIISQPATDDSADLDAYVNDDDYTEEDYTDDESPSESAATTNPSAPEIAVPDVDAETVTPASSSPTYEDDDNDVDVALPGAAEPDTMVGVAAFSSSQHEDDHTDADDADYGPDLSDPAPELEVLNVPFEAAAPKTGIQAAASASPTYDDDNDFAADPFDTAPQLDGLDVPSKADEPETVMEAAMPSTPTYEDDNDDYAADPSDFDDEARRPQQETGNSLNSAALLVLAPAVEPLATDNAVASATIPDVPAMERHVGLDARGSTDAEVLAVSKSPSTSSTTFEKPSTSAEAPTVGMDGASQHEQQQMRPPDDNPMETTAIETAVPADIAHDDRASDVYTPLGTDDGSVRSTDDTVQATPSSEPSNTAKQAVTDPVHAATDVAPPQPSTEDALARTVVSPSRTDDETNVINTDAAAIRSTPVADDHSRRNSIEELVASASKTSVARSLGAWDAGEPNDVDAPEEFVNPPPLDDAVDDDSPPSIALPATTVSTDGSAPPSGSIEDELPSDSQDVDATAIATDTEEAPMALAVGSGSSSMGSSSTPEMPPVSPMDSNNGAMDDDAYDETFEVESTRDLLATLTSPLAADATELSPGAATSPLDPSTLRDDNVSDEYANDASIGIAVPPSLSTEATVASVVAVQAASTDDGSLGDPEDAGEMSAAAPRSETPVVAADARDDDDDQAATQTFDEPASAEPPHPPLAAPESAVTEMQDEAPSVVQAANSELVVAAMSDLSTPTTSRAAEALPPSDGGNNHNEPFEIGQSTQHLVTPPTTETPMSMDAAVVSVATDDAAESAASEATTFVPQEAAVLDDSGQLSTLLLVPAALDQEDDTTSSNDNVPATDVEIGAITPMSSDVPMEMLDPVPASAVEAADTLLIESVHVDDAASETDGDEEGAGNDDDGDAADDHTILATVESLEATAGNNSRRGSFVDAYMDEFKLDDEDADDEDNTDLGASFYEDGFDDDGASLPAVTQTLDASNNGVLAADNVLLAPEMLDKNTLEPHMAAATDTASSPEKTPSEDVLQELTAQETMPGPMSLTAVTSPPSPIGNAAHLSAPFEMNNQLAAGVLARNVSSMVATSSRGASPTPTAPERPTATPPRAISPTPTTVQPTSKRVVVPATTTSSVEDLIFHPMTTPRTTTPRVATAPSSEPRQHPTPAKSSSVARAPLSTAVSVSAAQTPKRSPAMPAATATKPKPTISKLRQRLPPKKAPAEVETPRPPPRPSVPRQTKPPRIQVETPRRESRAPSISPRVDAIAFDSPEKNYRPWRQDTAAPKSPKKKAAQVVMKSPEKFHFEPKVDKVKEEWLLLNMFRQGDVSQYASFCHVPKPSVDRPTSAEDLRVPSSFQTSTRRLVAPKKAAERHGLLARERNWVDVPNGKIPRYDAILDKYCHTITSPSVQKQIYSAVDLSPQLAYVLEKRVQQQRDAELAFLDAKPAPPKLRPTRPAKPSTSSAKLASTQSIVSLRFTNLYSG